MRRRGAMEPHAGNAEMVGPTAEAERGEKRTFLGFMESRKKWNGHLRKGSSVISQSSLLMRVTSAKQACSPSVLDSSSYLHPAVLCWFSKWSS